MKAVLNNDLGASHLVMGERWQNIERGRSWVLYSAGPAYCKQHAVFIGHEGKRPTHALAALMQDRVGIAVLSYKKLPLGFPQVEVRRLTHVSE